MTKALNRPDSSLFCHGTGSTRGWSIFSSVNFSTSFKPQNIYFFKKKVPLKLLKVTVKFVSHHFKIHLDSLLKMLLGELRVFAYIIFHKRSANQQKPLRNGFSCHNKSLPKISLILQKTKISPKSYMCFLCKKSFNY